MTQLGVFTASREVTVDLHLVYAQFVAVYMISGLNTLFYVILIHWEVGNHFTFAQC